MLALVTESMAGGEPFVGRDFRIGCEFPSGTYLQPDRQWPLSGHRVFPP